MRSSRGLTLVEVMISTVLASLVVAGGFAIMASQRPVITGQMKIQKRQQDLWVAMEFIQRDFRKAGMGFGFCTANQGGNQYKAHANVWPAGQANSQVLRPIVITDGGANGSDTLQIMWFEPQGVGAGNARLDGAQPEWRTDGTKNTFNVEPAGSTAIGPEGAQGFMTGAAIPAGQACGAAVFGGPTFGLIFANNTAATNKECWVFSVTGANCATKTLVTDHRPTILGAVAPAYPPLSGLVYTGPQYNVANLGVQRVVVYSINPGVGKNPPQLERTVNGGAPDVVAFGIEDLQLSPGCDVNANGVIDLEPGTDVARATDEWFYNVPGENIAPLTCTAFPQVRVSLVSRTIEPDGGWTVGVRPKLENHVGGVANDQFHRRVLSQVVSAQNAAL